MPVLSLKVNELRPKIVTARKLGLFYLEALLALRCCRGTFPSSELRGPRGEVVGEGVLISDVPAKGSSHRPLVIGVGGCSLVYIFLIPFLPFLAFVSFCVCCFGGQFGTSHVV